MRPEIPGALGERIETIYEDAGYSTGSELVRDAVRRWLDTLEARFLGEESPRDPDFTFAVSSNSALVRLRLTPTEDSDLQVSNRGGQSQSVPTLVTGDTTIRNDTLKPALEQVDGVKRGTMTATGEIEIQFERDGSADLQAAVDEVFGVIEDVIERKNVRVRKWSRQRPDSQRRTLNNPSDRRTNVGPSIDRVLIEGRLVLRKSTSGIRSHHSSLSE